jgi:hypothetical protein
MMSRQAKKPPNSGEITQLAAIYPIITQFTEAMPMPTMANPTIPPTMLWVVETGHPCAEGDQQPDCSSKQGR